IGKALAHETVRVLEIAGGCSAALFGGWSLLIGSRGTDEQLGQELLAVERELPSLRAAAFEVEKRIGEERAVRLARKHRRERAEAQEEAAEQAQVERQEAAEQAQLDDDAEARDILRRREPSGLGVNHLLGVLGSVAIAV